MVTESAAELINLGGVYTLIRGVQIVARSDDTVQIGSEAPRWLLLHHPPANAVSILKALNGTRALGDVLDRQRADPLLWRRLLTRLRDARLLVPAADWSFPGMEPGPFLEPERDSLVHRHGIAVARRVLQARQDAVVVVRGSGRVATAVATSLAVSGLGHVHQQPDRALRPADLPPFETAAPTAGADRVTHHVGSATRADASLLAANLHRAAPNIHVHAPAAHHRVSLVVLAGDGPPAPSLAAELTGQRIPHLAVRAGLTSATVGPFVLPGRSSCLVCALRQRTDRDGGRPAFEEGLRLELVVPPARLVCAAAALGVADALDHLDGITVPSTVDGTVEWLLGDRTPRRRSLTVHPDCGCCSAPPRGASPDPADAVHREP